MNHYIMDAFLNTPDFGEDSYLYNSSSSSDSEDEVECTCSENIEPSVKKPRIEGYVEIEVPKLNEYDFRNSFRVNKETFQKVFELVQEAFISEHKGGFERISPEKGTYILLWYLGNQETFKQMSERFKKTMSCIHHVIKVGTKILSSKINEQIVWPSPEEYPSIAKLFQDVCDLKNCLGIVGVSHFKIPKPKEPENYMCSQNFHSVALQGTVTINGKFIDVHISEGSKEPEYILEKSSLLEEAEKGLLGEYYLLSFNSYVSRSWLIQPFTDSITPSQGFFNSCYATAANIFPESLGILKGRFQRLQHFENRDIPFVVNCIEAACSLHNLSIDCDEDNTDFDYADPGIFQNSLNFPELETLDGSDTRKRVFEELIRQ